jgi:hypothetical protein
MGGAILRGALNDAEQQWFYDELSRMPDPHHEDVESLRMTANPAAHQRANPSNRPQPIATWCHPYSRLSSARQRPTRLLQWAQRVMHALAPAAKGTKIDSMLAQLYAPGGGLHKHKDLVCFERGVRAAGGMPPAEALHT